MLKHCKRPYPQQYDRKTYDSRNHPTTIDLSVPVDIRRVLYCILIECHSIRWIQIDICQVWFSYWFYFDCCLCSRSERSINTVLHKYGRQIRPINHPGDPECCHGWWATSQIYLWYIACKCPGAVAQMLLQFPRASMGCFLRLLCILQCICSLFHFIA